MVLLHTRVGTVAASGFAVMLALYLLQQVGQPGVGFTAFQIKAWLVVKLLVAGLRIALAHAYSRLGAENPAWPRWQAAMLGLLVVDGAVWGASCLPRL